MNSISNATNCICITESLLCNVAYILAITFQLTAALLLVGNTSTSRKGIISTYRKQNRGIVFYEKGTLASDEGLIDAICSVWINKLAFVYLTVGYLISVWGERTIGRMDAFLVILGLTVALYVLTQKWTKYVADDFVPLRRDELPMEGGVMFSEIEDEK